MLVNYEFSDSENENSDKEDEGTLNVSIDSKPTLSFPSSTKKFNLTEENDEFLHKKETPNIIPPKAGKVKILIPRLSEFLEDEGDLKIVKVHPVNKKNGLLNLLPRPSNSTRQFHAKAVPTKTPVKLQKTVIESTAVRTEISEKKSFIPYALMSHNPKKKPEEIDDEEHLGSFFSFASEEDDLPQVNETEVQALVAKETARMELRKRQFEGAVEEIQEEQTISLPPEQQDQKVDAEAMKMLLGGNRAKRSRIDEIQIIDISSNEVLPDKNEFMRKSIAGETSYIPTGNIVDKGPTALSKRKHQISYLSMRAENNVAELEAMWAANRLNKRETKSKYGF